MKKQLLPTKKPIITFQLRESLLLNNEGNQLGRVVQAHPWLQITRLMSSPRPML